MTLACLKSPSPRQSAVLILLTVLVFPQVFLWAVEQAGLTIYPVDFFAYRYGVQTALRGENLYTSWVDGPGLGDPLPFTYPPFGALFLLPTTLGSERIGYMLWTSLNSLAFLLALRWTVPALRHSVWRLLGVYAALHLLPALAHNLMFGQINLTLTALIVYDLYRLQTGEKGPRLLPVGALIGVAAAVKITPALFILWLLIVGQRRAALAGLASGALCTLLSAALLPGSAWTFFTDTFWGLSSRVDLNGVFTEPPNSSIQGLVAYYWPEAHWLRPVAAAAVAVVLLAGATMAARRGDIFSGGLVVGMAACAASPIAWIHHWTFLVLALVLVAVRGGTRLRAMCAVIAVGHAAALEYAGGVAEALGGPFGHALALGVRAWVPVTALCLSAALVSLSRRTEPGRHDSADQAAVARQVAAG